MRVLTIQVYKFDIDYIKDQIYLNPHPKELMLLNHVWVLGKKEEDGIVHKWEFCVVLMLITAVLSETGFSSATTRKTFQINKRYLNLPVRNDIPRQQVKVFVANEVVRHFDIRLVSENPDFWVFVDMQNYSGKRATLDLGKSIGSGIDLIYQFGFFSVNFEIIVII